MIASAQTLRKYKPITPFHERTVFEGFTFGLGPAGYDIRIAEDVNIEPGGFCLASSMEEFWMPRDMLAVVHDKSTWARLGLCVQNTVIDTRIRRQESKKQSSNKDSQSMQTRRRSLIESATITILGMGYAVPLNYVFLTKIEWSNLWTQSFWMTFWFVVCSIVFKYFARRFFNWLDANHPSQ